MFNPFHFWQLADTTIVPLTSTCQSLIFERAWYDTTKRGREEIRRAITEAERMLTRELGYPPTAMQICEEIDEPYAWAGSYHESRRRRARSVYRSGSSVSIQLKYGKVQAIGRWAYAELGEYAVALSDLDSDGLYDTFTVSIPWVSGEDYSGIQLYFADQDWINRMDDAGRQIGPITMSESGGVLTIMGRSWTLADPSKQVPWPWTTPNTSGALNPTLTTSYVDTLLVKNRTIDTTSAISVVCASGSCDGITTTCTDVKYNIIDSSTGLIEIVFPSGTTPTCIDTIHVEYIAGDCDWDIYTARLTAGLLGRQLCECQNQELAYWQHDLSVLNTADAARDLVLPGDLANPLGLRRGQREAWRQVRRRRRIKMMTV